MPKILITGCGRSGTNFTSDLLNKLDIDVKHEKLGTQGIVSWLEAPKINKYNDYDLILHQIRNPLDCISSMKTTNNNSWKYICLNIKEININDNINVKCAKYWYYWNLLCENNNIKRFQVENIEIILPEITKLFNITKDYNNIINTLKNKKINSRFNRYKKISWSDIEKYDKDIVSKCKVMANRYGYDVT